MQSYKYTSENNEELFHVEYFLTSHQSAHVPAEIFKLTFYLGHDKQKHQQETCNYSSVTLFHWRFGKLHSIKSMDENTY